MGYFVKNRGAGLRPYGASIPSGGTADRPTDPKTASVRYNQDLGTMEFWDGVEYVSVVTSGNVDIVVDKFTGDASTALFSLTFDALSDDQILVYVGGVYQIGGTSYTTSGTNLTFSTPPPNNAPIAVVHNIGRVA